MLMGYKRPDYLAKIGRLNADEATIDMLEDTIEQQAPYISDFFKRTRRLVPSALKKHLRAQLTAHTNAFLACPTAEPGD